MTDPQVQALAVQVQANTAHIQTESSARAATDEALGKRIGSLEAVITGRTQSVNYMPGLSGWKLDPISGEFEINSCTLGSTRQAPERQMVSVEVASYSKYDLPKNAANLVQFMDAELQKVPDEYRHAAEFEEFDASYGDDSFSSRLFLSYSRPETEEELADRLEKAKSAGTQVKIGGGVISIIHDGVLRCRFGKLAAFEAEHGADAEPAKPFVVVDATARLNAAFIKDGAIEEIKVKQGAENRAISGRLDALNASLDRFALERYSEFTNLNLAQRLLADRLERLEKNSSL